MKLTISILSYFFVIVAFFSVPAAAQSPSRCPNHATTGNDFWVTFIPNGKTAATDLSLIVTGLNDAIITVENPRTGWNTTASHTGGNKLYIPLSNATGNSIPSATAASMGYHVTSTADISLYASNYIKDSWDLCHVLPTERLTSQYIAQDYPNNSDYSGAMALVATEDSTVFTMVLPCAVEGLNQPAGSTYTVTLDAGQTLAMKCGINDGFCGMTVTSNNKPFALFQGHSCARVGTDDTQRGRDHIVEQSIPLDWWGTEFVVVSEQARTEGDRILITASSDSTTVDILGTLGNITHHLGRGETFDYHLPANSAAHITSTRPVYVCKYLISFDKTNPSSLGDPASVDIPPIHNWLCNTTFPVHNCNTNPSDEQYITANHHYLDIVTWTAAVDSMRLDGQYLPASQFTALAGTPYSYYHGLAAVGAHRLTNNGGPFYATVSGHGRWVAYAFLAGMGLDTVSEPYIPQMHRDTANYSDTVCQGQAYNDNGFSISAEETLLATVITRLDSTLFDDTTIHYRSLTLTVMPTSIEEVYESIRLGDTVFFADTAIIDSGTYVFHLTASTGCDSTITLHIASCEPEVCIEFTGRPFIDFDRPVVSLHDCTPNRQRTSWVYSDGYRITGERSRRQFRHPLPDTITVTMITCNKEGCCADTTIGFKPKIRSVWFPNIFAPGQETNNRFQATTSCQVASFELTIYNRWGLEVWTTSDINTPWDGTRDGTPLPQGAYVYYWFLEDIYGDRWSDVGTVTLIR